MLQSLVPLYGVRRGRCRARTAFSAAIPSVEMGSRSYTQNDDRRINVEAKLRGTAEDTIMNVFLRAAALIVTVVGATSCATTPSALAQNEYRWVLQHGGCDCGPVAYAPRSVDPSWRVGQTVDAYVRDRIATCTSRQYVLAAFGDGGRDLASDTSLARERAKPFLRRLSKVKNRRIDTLLIAGPKIAHPATLAIMCPTDPLPARKSFEV